MQTESKLIESADTFIQGLLDPAAYPHPVSGLRLIETHISWIVLTGDFAYKIKKPVKLPFVDFSTLARRRFFCKEELRINSRFSDELYVDVVPIAGPLETPRVNATPAIEYAVRLRQFPQERRLDRQLAEGRLDVEDARHIGRMIAEFQRELVDDRTTQERDPVFAVVSQNLREVRDLIPDDTRPLELLTPWTEQRLDELAPLFEARRAGGFVREGHGDLHLENLVRLTDGRIVAFDALEFDSALRFVDTVDEVAFTAMDLMAHGRRDLAWNVLNAWFERSGDFEALGLLRFYLVYRALVRAKVAILRDGDGRQLPDRAAALFDLAHGLARKSRPLLILTHGMSGSGKTTFTESLIGELGAIRIRSDVERKRLFGLDPQDASDSALDAGIYGEEATEKTYQALEEAAGHALGAGFNVIVDATFLRKQQRERFRDLAADHCARRIILDCRAPVQTLRERIHKRHTEGRDESEATLEVLDNQRRAYEPLSWDEQCSQVLIDSPTAARIPMLLRQIRTIGDPIHRPR